MGKIPNYEADLTIIAENKDGLPPPKLNNPLLKRLLDERRNHLQQPQTQDPDKLLKKTVLAARVIIVEGISGSGKDTFQEYLKELLKGRLVYDYSEGEVLHSWKQLQIEGISEVRVKFMKLFANHIKDAISRDGNAVFLLNRFHLSTYASTIVQHPTLERDYDDIINILRVLPVHIFILQLDENEIEKRSLHPERSSAWHKFQQQIVDKHSFRDRLERQQKLILNAAKRQQIPYSLMKLADEPKTGNGHIRLSKAPGIPHDDVEMNAVNVAPSRSKRHPTPIL